MSCDPCDFERYINGDDTPTTQTIEGEWLKMIFPVGTMPIYTGDLDPNPQWFLSVEFTEEGNAHFVIQETEHGDGYRTGKEHTICGFTLSPELLDRIARVARS
jgi:hypothetical protein